MLKNINISSNEKIARGHLLSINKDIKQFGKIKQKNISKIEHVNQRQSLNLNIAPQYASYIFGFNSCRELIQNWFDSNLDKLNNTQQFNINLLHDRNDEKIFGFFDIYDTFYGYIMLFSKNGHNYVQLTNFNTILKSDILVLGQSEKKNANCIGGYGEGMKVEINRLIKNGKIVNIFTNNERWSFTHDLITNDGKVKSLFCHIDYFSEMCNHTSIVVNLKNENINIDNFLFLNGHNYTKLNNDNNNNIFFLYSNCKREYIEILTKPQYRGKIFIKGIFVCKGSNMNDFGLNLELSSLAKYDSLKFGRDRNSVFEPYLFYLLLSSFMNQDNNEDKMLNFYKNIINYFYNFPFSNPFSIVFDHYSCPKLNDIFVKFFFKCNPKCIPVTSEQYETEKTKIEYLGWTPLLVPDNLLKIYKKSKDFPSDKQLWDKLAAEILALPDDLDLNLTFLEFRKKIIQFFPQYLSNNNIIFKKFPYGNQNQLIVPCNNNSGKVYCIDKNLLIHEHANNYLQKNYLQENCTQRTCNCILIFFSYEFIKMATENIQEKNRLLNQMLRNTMPKSENYYQPQPPPSPQSPQSYQPPSQSYQPPPQSYQQDLKNLRLPNEKRNEIYNDGSQCIDHTLKNLPLLSNNQGIKVYSKKENVNQTNLNVMTKLIFELSTNVFGYSIDKLAIYNSVDSSIVAFNANEYIYFNLAHWERNVHHAYEFWFVIFCHELAHNQFSNHGKSFSWAEEQIMTNNLSKFIFFFNLDK